MATSLQVLGMKLELDCLGEPKKPVGFYLAGFERRDEALTARNMVSEELGINWGARLESFDRGWVSERGDVHQDNRRAPVGMDLDEFADGLLRKSVSRDKNKNGVVKAHLPGGGGISVEYGEGGHVTTVIRPVVGGFEVRKVGLPPLTFSLPAPKF